MAELFDVGRATVNTIYRLYRETGGVEPLPHGGHPPRRLDEAGEQVLLDLVREFHEATWVELTDETHAITGVSVSRATVGRILRRRGITRKAGRSSRASSS